MPSERVQRQIDRLLDEAEQASAERNWVLVRERCEHVLTFDPENEDALALLAAAERGPAAGDVGRGSLVMEGREPEPSVGTQFVAPAPPEPSTEAAGKQVLPSFEPEGTRPLSPAGEGQGEGETQAAKSAPAALRAYGPGAGAGEPPALPGSATLAPGPTLLSSLPTREGGTASPSLSDTPDLEPDTLAQTFANGRYRVAKFLGEGGKKKVYLAHDELLDRDVAFALIKTEGLDDVGRDRIRREAQAMGRLGAHPHIVSVFDLGEIPETGDAMMRRDSHRRLSHACGRGSGVARAPR